jgi:signal transduction histidine kinase
VRKQLQGLVEQSSLLDELFLLDLKGKVVISTNPEREAKDYRENAIFKKGIEEPYSQLPYNDPLQFDQQALLIAVDPYSVFVSRPVVDEDGEVRGVMGGRAEVNTLLALLQEQTGLGKTGKTYIVNEHQVLLNGIEPANNAQSDMDVPNRIDSEGIRAAIQRASENSGVFTDYFDNSVVGTYRWIPGLRAVLAVEQDSSEALQAASTTAKINLVIAIVSVMFAVIASLLVTRSIANPIINLADTASKIANGDLNQIARVERDDEVGALARAFNSMTAQLRELINSLEIRVKDRTSALQEANTMLEHSALQQGIIAQVGREITSILEIDILLSRVVELIQEAFHYYHVQVFLISRDSNQLVLRANTSNRFVQHMYIDLETKSINSKVAQTGESLIVNDVSQNSDYLFDHQLPETRSELVVPLRLGERVIGTLDVHNSKVNAFTEEDKLVIQSLGDQIAIAIENAYLYDQSKALAILEERNRLARDLHDSVTQSLYSLVLLTEGWRRMLGTPAEVQADEYLHRIGEIALQALKEMRLLIYELRPPDIEHEGLVGALQKRIDAVEKRVGIEARVIMEDFIELSTPVEDGLYRIAQEALNNALKHAEAKKITVRIYTEKEMIVLEIADNGRGFDPNMNDNLGGMGVINMRERALMLQGSLTIQSILGEGTRVIVRAPFLQGKKMTNNLKDGKEPVEEIV